MNNNKQPKISIIIPIYNVGRHLKNALCSIVNQTLKELEFVCVDDYSTDNSPAILKSFADKDPRFRIIRQEKNKGTCQARKDGVLASTGKYILFLDCFINLSSKSIIKGSINEKLC